MKDTWKDLNSLIDVDKPTLITGDFNVCTLKDQDNGITSNLKKWRFSLMTHEATHIQGGHIDHVYWRDTTKQWMKPKVERYSPYWSDHDALLVTLTKRT